MASKMGTKIVVMHQMRLLGAEAGMGVEGREGEESGGETRDVAPEIRILGIVLLQSVPVLI